MAETNDIRFEGWILRRSAGELVREGVCIRLQEQPLQILEQLLTQPGELVTREQLITKLWPTGVVDFDTGLNTAMRKLRLALSDDAETPRYIETIPRRGYRFIGRIDARAGLTDTSVYLAPVDSPAAPSTSLPDLVMGAQPSESPAEKPWPRTRLMAWFGLALVVVATVATVFLYKNHHATQSGIAATIVVLPFVDMSREQQDQPLCDGLSEELSNWLAQVPTLRVVSRSSAFSYKGKSIDARQIGKEVNATHVLEGSVRRNGKDVRVTAQLINAKDGLHIWSKSFDMPAINVLQVEDRVSQAVVEALQMRLSATTSERWASRRPEKIDSYELYLIARHHYLERTRESNARAIELYRQALATDAKFALAYVGLAEAHINERYLSDLPITEITKVAEPLLAEARRLKPNLTEMYAASGWLLTEQSNLDGAQALLAKAISMNPSDAPSHRYLAEVHSRKGQPLEAVAQYKLAAELDPVDFMAHIRLCLALQEVGNVTAAASSCNRALALQPANFWSPLAMSWLAVTQGRLDESSMYLRKALRLAPEQSWLIDDLGETLITLGLTDDARKLYIADARVARGTQQLRLGVLAMATHGGSDLGSEIAKIDVASIRSIDELINLMRLQHAAGDREGALSTLARIKASPDYTTANLFDPKQVRNEYARALYCGAVELSGGDKANGERLLRELSQMLDRLESNGGNSHGLHSLRAYVLALQGDGDQAMVALSKAASLGWRWSWRAQKEPYLRALWPRSDYKALIKTVEADNLRMRQRVEASDEHAR